MSRVWLSLALGLMLLAPARADETSWLKLSTMYRYYDRDTACHHPYFFSHAFLNLSFAGGRLRSAGLRTWNYLHDARHDLWLTVREMRGMKLYRDRRGQIWMKKLPVSERMFIWLVSVPELDHGFCLPKAGLARFMPAPALMEFELEGLKEGIYLSYTPKMKFSGVRQDGVPYQGHISLVQTVPRPLELWPAPAGSGVGHSNSAGARWPGRALIRRCRKKM